MFLVGCEQKQQVITKTEVVKVQVPKNFFVLRNIDINRTISTQKDVANLLLDVYQAYEECNTNLKAIKRWSYEQ